MPADFDIPIVIVGFGHSEDIVKCLTAVGAQRRCPKFEVFLCENGGAAAFDALEAALSQKGGPCEGGAQSVEPTTNDFVRARRLRLAGGAYVTIGQARDNLGFAGGTNAWVRPLLAEPSWTAVWILNPDTYPEPDALAELVDYAEKRGKGMVGSRLMIPGRSDISSSRGLKWNKLSTTLIGLDMLAPVSPAPDPKTSSSEWTRRPAPRCMSREIASSGSASWTILFFYIGRKSTGGCARRRPAPLATPIIPSFRISAGAPPALPESARSVPPLPSILATATSFTSCGGITQTGLRGRCSYPSLEPANICRSDQRGTSPPPFGV